MIINYLISNIDAKRETVIAPETQIGIANNIIITDIEKDEKFKILKFTFKFEAKFTGNDSSEIGKIAVQGVIVYTGDNIEKVHKVWKDEKRLDDSVSEEILQSSLNISILEAMSIAKILQLPSILPLPKISNSKGTEEEPKSEKKQKK